MGDAAGMKQLPPCIPEPEKGLAIPGDQKMPIITDPEGLQLGKGVFDEQQHQY
jgi:hypothetical protein